MSTSEPSDWTFLQMHTKVAAPLSWKTYGAIGGNDGRSLSARPVERDASRRVQKLSFTKARVSRLA